MAGRMLRVLSSKQSVYRQLLVARNQVSAQGSKSLFREDVYSSTNIRQFSVFNEFSKQFKGEANSNEDFQRSVKELKEKAEELKGVKEDLKVRTKQTTEQLYKHVDGVWTEAEAAAKKVSANLKEKVSAATDEVKGSFGIGKQDPSNSYNAKDNSEQKPSDNKESSSGEETQQKTDSTDTSETIFGKVKSTISPKVLLAFQKIKEASPIDFAKKGYNIVRDELSGNSSKRKRIEYEASDESAPKVERSSATGIVVVPVKQSKWSKKWEAFKQKMQGNPVFKRVSGLSEPVVSKGQELAEDMRERWETSDNPVVHKIQDLNESVFGETTAAMSFKEIRRRDPSFSLPDFVSEVREVIRPVLTAYFKGDNETLKKYCSPEVITRCMAEHKAYAVADIFFDNKILHISEVEVRETKMMEDRPIIIVAFQTQQVYCIRNKLGQIKEGGTDTIHTVYYMWAMQQFDVQDLGEGALFPIWRLREMQQQGVQALI